MDTGLLYRAVALNLWRWGGDPSSEFEALRNRPQRMRVMNTLFGSST